MLLGCDKLNINNYYCKVVLEEDGTEIDDDETLLEFHSHTQSLMILQSGEDWSRASEQNEQTAEQAGRRLDLRA